jgi:hypothetical protein
VLVVSRGDAGCAGHACRVKPFVRRELDRMERRESRRAPRKSCSRSSRVCDREFPLDLAPFADLSLAGLNDSLECSIARQHRSDNLLPARILICTTPLICANQLFANVIGVQGTRGVIGEGSLDERCIIRRLLREGGG